MSLLGRQHETRRVVGATIGIVASALCAVAMVGNVAWADKTNWFLFALAGFGVVGFGTMALDQWPEWPKGVEPAWTHWFGAIFWTAFGAYQAFALGYQVFITEADPNWAHAPLSYASSEGARSPLSPQRGRRLVGLAGFEPATS